MSSWKKASKINQKTHRERHQPESRAHLGLLEKKKDYKQRADDYNQKQALLKKLKVKALNKSPDEFYFHMINSKTVDGEHREKKRDGDKHTAEQLKLMESKDLNYVAFRRTLEAKAIDKLQARLHLIDEASSVRNKHTFFVESADEVKSFNLAQRLDTVPELIPRRTNRLRTGELQSLALPSLGARAALSAERHRERAYNILAKRIRRERQLTIVQDKLQVSRQLRGRHGLQPVKVKNATKSAAAVYQWPYVRKR